jgi:hypothetical protein
MAFQMTMNMTYAGREPEVLSDLILRRQKVLGETAQQAVIGTANSVMHSMRARTIIADDNSFTFVRSMSARVKWVTKNKRHSMKVEGWGEDKKFINLGGPYQKGAQYYAYVAKILKNGQPASLWFIARHDQPVAAYLKRRIHRYRGMAKSAWGHLMRMTSQYTPEFDPVSSAAVNTLRKHLSVLSGGNQYDYAVQITDDLRYAAAALQGGTASVTYAMQAASNKIAGRIRKFIAEHPSLSDQNIQTPFPEIRKAR